MEQLRQGYFAEEIIDIEYTFRALRFREDNFSKKIYIASSKARNNNSRIGR